MDEIKIAVGDLLSDQQAMLIAISEAKKGAGFVSPNPQVGCVVLDSKNQFLAKGFHVKYGGPHAEVEAVKGLSPEALKGARVFVTLEPCAHEGKTPSCAKMLAKLPIGEVVYGLKDPNPLVAGQGAAIIKAAGIQTTIWKQNQSELEEVCEHFLMNFRQQKPFVSLKVASSLDGQLALKTGDSKWITGERAREQGHYLRATHDATLVGVNTVLIDDAKLNVRHPRFPQKKNKVIVQDPEGELLSKTDLQIFSAHQPEDLLIVVGPDCKVTNSTKATVLTCSMTKKLDFDLGELLGVLWQAGMRSILVEGGAYTLSSFIMQKEAHRLYLFQASVLLGSGSGKSWSEQVNISSMVERIAVTGLRTEWFQPDLLVTGRFV